MRFEVAGLGHFLRFIGIFGGALGAWWFVATPNSFEKFSYYLTRIDPLYAGLIGLVLALIFVPPLIRLYRERRLWMVLQEPFEQVSDPFIDIDVETEAFGELLLAPNARIKRVAIHATRQEIIVRKAAYPIFFPTFRIPWSQVSNVYIVSTGPHALYGKDSLGFARITLSFSEETVLVLPWRGRFNAYVPESAGLQTQVLKA